MRKLRLMFRWTFVFVLLGMLHVHANAYRQNRQQVTLSMKAVSLKDVLWAIERQTSFVFMYNEEDLDKIGKVDVDVQGDDIRTILNVCLRNTNLTYVLQDEVIVIKPEVQSQKVKEVRIKGTVKDEKGHLLPGVTVFIKGLQIGTVTDGDGRFTIAIPDMESIVLQFGFDFYLVDTAGIRKKNKVSEDLEYYSVIRSIRSIENSDVCILMLDATRGIEGQDLNIFSLVQRNQKGLVVVVNKWDLIEDKTAKVMKGYEDAIRDRLAPFTDFPIVFTSALTKQRILKVLELAKEVYQARTTRIPTARLNEELLPLIEAYPPPSNKGKYIKIKYITQLPNTQVPSFVFFANLPQYVKEPYRRFLENKIRERWKLSGTPINIFIRQK